MRAGTIADRRRRSRRTPSRRSLRTLLEGGDRRSIARSSAALEILIRDPDRIAELVALTRDADWLVVMRALDLLEKLAHSQRARVQRFKHLFIGPLADRDQWEIRLQIVRTLPLLTWTPAERARVIAILRRDVSHPQTFVRAWALDGLAKLADQSPSLLPEVEEGLTSFERSGKKALVTRARHIRDRAGTLP